MERSLKSKLALELEAEQARLKAAKRELAGETEDVEQLAKREEELLKKKLTRDELIARRKELAYLKIRESQKSLKARKQNKIKSKKYHKLLKKQKMQEQIKQFEILQKTNPEAALEKLNELEKNRVLERASLRHKNTGTWAKNLQIRAKYDKDVRKDLSEQLQISRKLTEKKIDSEDENDDDNTTKASQIGMEKELNESDPFNPWTRIGSIQKGDGPNEVESENWRKYWLDRNENEKMLDEYKKLLVKDEMSDDEKQKYQEAILKDDKLADVDDSSKKGTTQKEKKVSKMSKNVKKAKKRTTVGDKEIKSSGPGERLVEETKISTSANASNRKDENNIDEIFDKQEDKVKKRMAKKMKELSKKAKLLKKRQLKNTKQKKRAKKEELKNLKNLSFKKEVKRPIIDEELGITEISKSNVEINVEKVKENVDISKKTQSLTIEPQSTGIKPSAIIDPNKLADVKIKQHVSNFIELNESIGGADDEVDMSGDEDNDKVYLDQQMTISQAFEDDDIIADFTRDKAKDSEVKDTEVDLFMPGWGSWAGSGISAERQAANKNKRLVLKLAKKEKRRDDNKGGLYINETASKQLRSHLVSEVPFPFTSVADYEGSIRATIGRNCVPETAFRMLTRPAIITLKGQVIEPMDQSEITKPQRRLRHVVDRRIARMNENPPLKIVKTK